MGAVSGRAGRPHTPCDGMPPKKKKAAKKEAPAPASAAAAPGVAAKATDDSAMQYIVMAECVSSRRFLPPVIHASHDTRPSSPTAPVPPPVRSQEPAQETIAHPDQDQARGTVRARARRPSVVLPLARHSPRAISRWSADLGARR